VVTGTAVDVRALVAAVPDPEIPVISIDDLGILRAVETSEDGTIVVTITPTYSGCPAMDAIRSDIRTTLAAHGFDNVEVNTVLRPAWSTDWMSERGRERLRKFGIAPPRPRGEPQLLQLGVACPRCASTSTRLVSHFGSTACKSHRVCNDCSEPFDHFKEL
jgi:ring-1,2-phenylacetyl-CoA epoxidase subunit PaaD